MSSFFNIEMENIEVSFSNQDSSNVIFTGFTNIPKVVAIGKSDGIANVNIFIESITQANCVVRTSSKITGTVIVRAIGYL
tara:strand:+ start:844 stop:1083 length:240 start_codon:yes stop_codon:yes gene_type:complete